MNDVLPSPLRCRGWLGLVRQCALLLLAGSIHPLAAAAPAAAPPLSAAQAEAASSAELEAAKAAIAGFSLSNIKLTTIRTEGASEVTAQAFQAELAKRLAERASKDPTFAGKAGSTIEVRFDGMTVQGDMTRGADGQPIPRDLFAATVRVLNEAGQEISIYVIPETQIRGDRLEVDTSKLLGVEGAAIVYRRLFGAL